MRHPVTRYALAWFISAIALGCEHDGASNCPPVRCPSPSPRISGDPPHEMSMAKLRQTKVIGALGVPLGQVVEISAVVVSGDTLRMKALAGKNLLRVESVNGRALAPPPTLEFGSAPGVALQLEPVPEASKVRLLTYETGAFTGIPDNLPSELVWQDTGFGLQTHLVLVQKR